MAKRQRQVSKKGSNFDAIEHVDDNLLPSAQELLEYKEVDPSLVPFLKERAQIEQEKRHLFNDEIMTLNKREQWLTHGLNYAALFCGLLVILSAMAVSYLLIIEKHVITGTIFGGIGLAYVVYLFISIANKSASAPKK